ncbi:MAG: hypothetical protein DI617_09035, partial [Streptococcus pyogenes]
MLALTAAVIPQNPFTKAFKALPNRLAISFKTQQSLTLSIYIYIYIYTGGCRKKLRNEKEINLIWQNTIGA